jgi:hypothetical protein
VSTPGAGGLSRGGGGAADGGPALFRGRRGAPPGQPRRPPLITPRGCASRLGAPHCRLKK